MKDDDVQLVDPAMAASSQGRMTSPRCRFCNGLTGTLALTCERCLRERYYQEMLEHQQEILRTCDEAQLTIARDRGGVRHLTFWGNDQLSWCNRPVTEEKKKRTRTRPGLWPPGVCPDCLRVFAELTGNLY